MKKYGFILFIIITTLFACKKEEALVKNAQYYAGTYVVESKTTKYTINEKWVCGTGLDSLQMYIQDSLLQLEPDFYADTIYFLDTIIMLVKENSSTVLIAKKILKNITYGDNFCEFYIPINTNELVFLNSNTNWISYSNDSLKSTFYDKEIHFNFRGISNIQSSSFTYNGIATKLY